MSGTFSAIALAIIPIVAGCSGDDPVAVDRTSPFPPDGVFSVTRDALVELYWNQNREPDLGGYAVYRSDAADGLYYHQADVAANRTWYDDTILNNGETWYYAVTAFDKSGNESELSFELVFDTPRPEGFNLVLFDFMGQNTGLSGYDFSGLSGIAQSWGSNTSDIYFGAASGVNYIWATSGVDIQDYGTIDLIDVDWAPESGWAPSARVEAIVGHSYVVRAVNSSTSKKNYAKIYVKSVTNPNLGVDARNVTLDWAYQTSDDNPELSPGLKGGAAR